MAGCQNRLYAFFFVSCFSVCIFLPCSPMDAYAWWAAEGRPEHCIIGGRPKAALHKKYKIFSIRLPLNVHSVYVYVCARWRFKISDGRNRPRERERERASEKERERERERECDFPAPSRCGMADWA